MHLSVNKICYGFTYCTTHSIFKYEEFTTYQSHSIITSITSIWYIWHWRRNRLGCGFFWVVRFLWIILPWIGWVIGSWIIRIVGSCLRITRTVCSSVSCSFRSSWVVSFWMLFTCVIMSSFRIIIRSVWIIGSFRVICRISGRISRMGCVVRPVRVSFVVSVVVVMRPSRCCSRSRCCCCWRCFHRIIRNSRPRFIIHLWT